MKNRIEGLLRRAIDRAIEGGRLDAKSLPPLLLSVPKDPKFGDLSSTVALHLAREEHKAPRVIAEVIRDHLDDPDGLVSEVTIDGPGFVNFHLSPLFWRDSLRAMEGPDYGRPNVGRGRRVLLEYVSANPTGPLHVGHGRGAVIGDVLARLLAATGYEVVREYYVNDAGKQMEILGRSVLARFLEVCGEPLALPEDAYPGEYLHELAEGERDAILAAVTAAAGVPAADGNVPAELVRRAGDRAPAVCGELAGRCLLDRIREDLAALRIDFDRYVSERVLREAGAVTETLAALEGKGLLFDAGGAGWFRSSRFGDEKDRVVRRSDGELTYFASDIAYHRDKLDRGFETLIDVWGADHHGYVARVRAAIQALGGDAKALEVLLVQMVRVIRAGEPVRMGKRSGEFISLRSVVEEVGADAARFFFLMRKADSHLDFDLDLAKKESAENPVFYVQYAHARVCSLMHKAAERGVDVPLAAGAALDRLDTPEELAVIRFLASFPDVVEEAARAREPHRIAFFLVELAGCFHRSYNRHHILSEEEPLRGARMYLAVAVRRVVRAGLDLLGVSAPDSM